MIRLLQNRAQSSPERVGYSFIRDDHEELESLTYGELDKAAKIIAGRLSVLGGKGERVLLLLRPGLSYVISLFATWYAGATAVPVFPSQRKVRLRDTRLQSIARDAEARFALVDARQSFDSRRIGVAPVRHWIEVDRRKILDDKSGDTLAVAAENKAPAILQYTSGTTGTPKGVVITHDNLIANSEAIRNAFSLSSEDRCLSWLPPYHDMGLVGGMLQPMFNGFPVVLTTPTMVLQHPLSWLEWISRLRITVSGGPNFAYALCARADTKAISELDLSSWRVAFCGAERIRPHTIAEFLSHFAPFGFRPDALHGCYGLAEATLLVTGGPMGPPLPLCDLQSPPCGTAGSGTKVRVVDPITLRPSDSGDEGEIWVAGPSIAAGYWNRPKETEQVFSNYLGSEGPFLRTGDFGCLRAAGLSITGRIKDIIVIRGRNHHPEDIEATVVLADRHIRPDAVAAFSIEGEDGEALVIAVQVDRHTLKSDYPRVLRAIRQAVIENHDVNPSSVLIVRFGSLPKTTSGKVQRSLCREQYLTGVLTVVGDIATAAPSSPRQKPSGTIELGLLDIVASAVHGTASDLSLHTPLTALGVDSIAAAVIKTCVKERFAKTVSIAQLLSGASVSQIAAELLLLPNKSSITHGPTEQRSEYPLSRGQQALWLLQLLDPANPAYQISRAARIDGPLDKGALTRAINALCQRHPALRTTFHQQQGIPHQRVADRGAPVFICEDVTDAPPSEIYQRLAQEAERVIDISTEHPVRVLLLRRLRNESYLLLVIHHLVSDYHSLRIFLEELAVLYAAECTNAPATLDAVDQSAYAHYVDWQCRFLADEEGEEMWRYWKSKLRPDLPAVNFAISRQQEAVDSWQGMSEAFQIDRELIDRLRSFAAAEGTTNYVVLLSAFQLLLHRYTGQRETVVGSPALGRLQPGTQSVAGYFVNPLVFVANFFDTDTFRSVVLRTRADVKEALDHQEYPFAAIVERLQPVRENLRTPLFQIVFAYERIRSEDGVGLDGFILGEDGAERNFANLTLRSVKLPRRPSQFDLTLTIADSGGGAITCSWLYNSALFERHTIRQLGSHFLQVLSTGLQFSDTAIAALPLLTPAEIVERLEQRQRTYSPFAGECIHHQFERQVRKSPEAIAIVAPDAKLTYAELNRRANLLAERLVEMGIGPESIVAILLDRSSCLVASILAVWKTGAAYLPLDAQYPHERIKSMVHDSGACAILTDNRSLAQGELGGIAVLNPFDTMDVGLREGISAALATDSQNLAYVIYTSGSTGVPKGVMVTHANIANLLAAMDDRIGSRPGDRLVSTTNITFDISVLELFWSLTRGITLLLEMPDFKSQEKVAKHPKFSLFYFSSEVNQADGYRLVRDGAKFADRAGFAAVWTPERHFHRFGGLFPNPSVLGAALAAETRRIAIRAGSVVLPLHHPVRVAEEWALVDNLSGGRAGVAFASGWHIDDFAFAPDSYHNRKEITLSRIATIRRLWRGESIEVMGGSGKPIKVRSLPTPFQREIPIWLTTGGSNESFVNAGKANCHVLTHLLGQDTSELKEKIQLYRGARAGAGFDPAQGSVALMIHTFVGSSLSDVLSAVRKPFRAYLRSSIDLVGNLARSLGRPVDPAHISEADMSDLLDIAYERYVSSNTLFGTPTSCLEMVERLESIGVNEVACMIDFGIKADQVLESLEQLDILRKRFDRTSISSLGDAQAESRPEGTLIFQSTPSKAHMLLADRAAAPFLKSIGIWLIGGEALTAQLVEEIGLRTNARIINMYGPTETTIWSTTKGIEGDKPVTLGSPILNTTVDIVDRNLQLLPDGVPGELLIGGAGVARGYLGRPDLTAAAFLPDQFGEQPGARIYRTGDLGRNGIHGIEFIGRTDHQFKLRGHRIEPAEIEHALTMCPGVRDAVVMLDGDDPTKRLIAYILQSSPPEVSALQIQALLRERLPAYMVPNEFNLLHEFPVTSNGKVNRDMLRRIRPATHRRDFSSAAPFSVIEKSLARVWAEVLNRDSIGVDDKFFDLGGHSLLLPEVQSRLRGLGFPDIPLVKLFEYPTISALAAFLGGLNGADFPVAIVEERASRQRAAVSRNRERRLMPGKSTGSTDPLVS